MSGFDVLALSVIGLAAASATLGAADAAVGGGEAGEATVAVGFKLRGETVFFTDLVSNNPTTMTAVRTASHRKRFNMMRDRVVN